MPQVPYTPYPTVQPTNRGTPFLSLSVPGAAFGTNIAEGIKAIGGGASQLGNELFQRAIALQQLQNETEAKEADAKYMMVAGKLHGDYSALQGSAAVAAFPKYQKDLNDARQQIRSGLSNDMARKLYDSSSLSTMGRSVFNGAGHAATQNKEWQVGTAKAQLDLDANAVMDNPNDDVLFQDKLNRTRVNAHNIAAVKGFETDGPEEKDLVLNATSKLWKQRINGAARVDPVKAESMLAEHKKELTETDYQAVDNIVRGQSRAIGSVNIANRVYAAGQGDAEHGPKSLKEMEAEVVAEAKKQFPDDPIMQNHAVAALRGQWNQQNYAQRQENWTNQQTIASAIQGGVKNIQELRADPKVAAAIDALPPKDQLKIPEQINRFNASRDKADNQEAFTQLWGLSNNDMEAFLNTDMTDPKYKLSQGQILRLQNRQAELKKNPRDDPRVGHAVSVIRQNLGSQLEGLGIYNRNANNKDDYDHFVGALSSALDVWQQTHKGAVPGNKDIIEDIAPTILRSHKVPSFFGLTSKEVPGYTQEVPDKWAKDYTANTGITDANQINRAYVRMLLLKHYEDQVKGELKPSPKAQETVPKGPAAPAPPISQ